MARRRTRWMRVIPTATLTVMPFTVFGPTAQAFFPPLPQSPPTPVTVVTPPDTPPVTVTVPPTPPPPFVPPSPPPPDIVPPPPPPPNCPPPPPHGCHTVPEPSTLIAAAAGLVAAAGWTLRRKKGTGNA
jgi:hypothetical protein